MIFRNWVLQNFPFLEDDFDALTDYELFCKMVEYMKKSLDKVVEYQDELNEFRTELDTYKNYFDNLDVQEEIDNKLDEMAESGELTDIIAQYLGLAGVLAFNTLNDLEDALNVVNGSICVILGKDTYNDGKTAYYKIREILNTDVIDGDELIAITNNNQLVGEKIPSYAINNLNTQVNTLNTQMSLINNKKVIILGDSYANRTNSWADRFRTYMGLTDSNSVIKKVSGVGFYNTVDNVNFSTMVVDDIPLTASEVTDIIVCGGYNDWGASDANLSNAFDNFITVCKTNYPNAKIYVGFIGWCKPPISNYSDIVGGLSYTRWRYKEYCGQYKNVYYLNNIEYSLHLASLLEDETYFHPNSDGQEAIAKNLVKAWQSGTTDVCTQQTNVTTSFTKESYIDTFNGAFYGEIENCISRLFTNGELYLDFDESTSWTFNNSLTIKIGKLLNGYVFGRGLTITNCQVTALVNTKTNGYFTVPANLYIDTGDLYLRIKLLTRTGDGWITDSLKYISIYGINIICDSMVQY